MPESVKSQCLVVKKIPTSFFWDDNIKRYEWQYGVQAIGQDYSDTLLKKIVAIYSPSDDVQTQNAFTQLSANTKDSLDVLSQTKIPIKKHITISMERIAFLDEINDWQKISNIVQCMMENMDKLLDKGNTISLDFKEVFFVPEGESPPLHYRPGVDICVSSIDEYYKRKNRLSYQFAKALLRKFRISRDDDSQSKQIINRYCTEPYDSKTHKNTIYQYTTPLNEIAFYDTELSYYLQCQYGSYNVMAFNYPVSVKQLATWLNQYRHEKVVLLKGKQYANESIRQKVYEELVEYIKNSECTNLIHVFLITDDQSTKNLLNLVPNHSNHVGPFQPLADGVGYYLSSTKLLAETHPYHHKLSSDLNSLRVITQSPKKRQRFSPGSYIITEEKSPDIRSSKLLSKEAIKSKVQLALSHQESVSQTQAVNEQIQESYVNTQNVKETQSEQASHTSSFHWFLWTANFQEYCQMLQAHAKKKLSQMTQDDLLFSQVYLTQYYCSNHSKKHYYEQIAYNESFREEIAAKLFGVARIATDNEHQSYSLIKMPHRHVDELTKNMADWFAVYSEHALDGLQQSNIRVEKKIFQGPVLYDFECPTYHVVPNPVPYQPLNLSKFHYLAKLQASPPEANEFDIPLDYHLLLPHDKLMALDEQARQKQIEQARSLLKLYQPNPPFSEKEIIQLEAYLFELVALYYPGNDEKHQPLQRLFARFEVHNADNLKIILQIILCLDKNGLDAFFELLTFLEERSLGELFYQYYFKFAADINSVYDLLVRPYHYSFLTLAARAHEGGSIQDTPAFEKFAFHLILYLKQNNYELTNLELNDLKKYWNRLYGKFVVYTGNQSQAKQLLDKLANNLVDEKKALSINHFVFLNTFFQGLEQLIDRAMEKDVLEEQIDEIKGLSLLPMDSSYAIDWNDFHLVCAEMKIETAHFNAKTKRYSVTKEELLQAILKHQPGDSYLKTATFRYLGGLSLREDIAFYRKLFTLAETCTDKNEAFIIECLSAFYVANYTGSDYGLVVDEKEMTTNFRQFLKKQDPSINLDLTKLSKYVGDFCQCLHQIPTNQQKGIESLWQIWQENKTQAFKFSKTPIPQVFLRKFPTKQLGRFLVSQKTAIEKELSQLNPDDKLAWDILDRWCRQLGISPEQKQILMVNLKTLFPQLNMMILLRHITQIHALLEQMSSLFTENPKSLLYLVLDDFSDNPDNLEQFLALTKLLSLELTNKNKNHQNKKIIQFLQYLSNNRKLYDNLPVTSALLSMVMSEFLKPAFKGDAQVLITLGENLIVEGEQAAKIFASLVPIIHSKNGHQFFSVYEHLTATQLKNLIALTQKSQSSSLSLTIAQSLLQKDKFNNFSEILPYLNNKSAEAAQILLSLGQILAESQKEDLTAVLKALDKHSADDLKAILRVRNLYHIQTETVLKWLHAPIIKVAIADFTKQKHLENLERYHYEPQFVKDKIAQIKLKSHQEAGGAPLSIEEQDALWQDYQTIMSYMTEKPIRLTINGITQELTINELDEQQFQFLFKSIQDKLKSGENRHDYQLLLIALGAEALYRTTHKFPRCTQILTLLQHLQHPNNIIHEVKTGEGKSIIAALHSVLLCAAGHTVDVATENNQLANDALEKFKPFYQYLGIDCGNEIILPDSERASYVDNGINYSTASNLSLFRDRMALAKKAMPRNSALIADEVDATLTSTVQFRLASTLDPQFSDTKIWDQIYQRVIDFVKEKEIFAENYCSEKDDIRNLRNYFLSKNPQKAFYGVTSRISDEVLSTLIDSAMIALQLEENVDYYVVAVNDNEGQYSYAAPIISSTNRPNPSVNYSDYVQQLVHTILNNKNPPPKHPFAIEPCSQTLVVTSANNFFDFYRLNKGPIVGLTGTAGSPVELAEFYQQQGLSAYSYPTFHPDLSEDLGLIAAFGEEDHLKKINEWITHCQTQNPSQPILIITDSPESTVKLNAYLASHPNWKVQIYHGYEETGLSEDEIILTAGQDENLTIANQSLARGADIDPANERGLLVVNTCVNLTPSELRQIQGRAARNGKQGQFISIINMETIASAVDSKDTLASKFKAHQLAISEQRQQERAKFRLLEDTRHLIVHQTLLKLREQADHYLSPQFGEYSSVVTYTQLLSDLSSFNHLAEKHYQELLKKYNDITDEFKDEFLQARIDHYQTIVDTWLPQEKYKDIEFVEPSICIDNLYELASKLENAPVEQLAALADIFHTLWKVRGHQDAQQGIHYVDELIELFAPYRNQTCSFKENLGQVLEQKGYLSPEIIDTFVEKSNETISDILNYATEMPVVGYLVPSEIIKNFAANYLQTTKEQIYAKQWDKISLPVIDISWITNWLDGIRKVLTVGAIMTGGPIAFLVNRFILPTITTWIKNALKHQFADSESQIAQILIGLDDIGKDLTDAINAFSAATTEENITVGDLIDKFGGLAKNKALILSLSKYLELSGKPHYIPYVQSIPEITKMLEPYREKKVEALFNVNTVVTLLKAASSSPLIAQFLEDTPYRASLEHLVQLHPEFILQLGNLSFPELVNLLKVIAHPNFFACLSKLPPKTSFKQLCQWLKEMPEDISEDSHLAIQSFLDYQNNNERIAIENKQKLLSLRERYTLSLDGLKKQLANNKPKVGSSQDNQIDSSDAAKSKAFPVGIKDVMIVIAITILVAFNVTHFSIPLAMVSLLAIGWLMYPYAKRLLSLLQTPQEQPKKADEPTSRAFIPKFSDQEFVFSNQMHNNKQVAKLTTNSQPQNQLLAKLTKSKFGFFNAHPQPTSETSLTQKTAKPPNEPVADSPRVSP
jgi:preprotein translocase subunit SecA